jgi:hypothetical protein
VGEEGQGGEEEWEEHAGCAKGVYSEAKQRRSQNLCARALSLHTIVMVNCGCGSGLHSRRRWPHSCNALQGSTLSISVPQKILGSSITSPTSTILNLHQSHIATHQSHTETPTRLRSSSLALAIMAAEQRKLLGTSLTTNFT